MNENQPAARPAQTWLFVTVILGFAAYYAYDVWGGRFETIAYGLLCITLLGVLGLLLVVSTIRQRGEREPRTATPGAGAEGMSTSLRPFLLLLLLGAYAGLQSMVGFPIATLLAFAALAWLFGERRWPYLLAIAIGMTLSTYVIFVELLSIPVPAGALFG